MIQENQQQILKLHVRILKCLLIWPLNSLSKKHNLYLTYGIFFTTQCCGIPVWSAAGYQFYVKIENVKILLEALVGIGDMVGYTLVYVCFLKNQENIQKLIIDFNQFLQYCGPKVIQEAEVESNRYTKYLLSYVTGGLLFNFTWQMMSTKSCIQQRGGDFYVKHDPCWMPVRNLYPFDANQSRYFWIVFPIEAVYSYHVSCFFSLATATIIGYLIHLSAQFRCCSRKFEHIFDNVRKDENSQNKAHLEFIKLIQYHQNIQLYSQRVFKVFSSTIVIYITLTSILVAVIGYQIVNPKISTQDRIKYAMLLVAWCLLVYSICLYGQQVQDEALKVGQSIFKCNWYKYGMSIKVKSDLIFTLARTQKPLQFKTQMIGSITLLQFMQVMKGAYSGLTLLLAVTDDA